MTISISSSAEKHDDIRSTLDVWASRYTPSETLRNAIIKRTLLIAAFDDKFVDKTFGDADVRALLHKVAQEMLREPPVPLICEDPARSVS